MRTDDTRLMRPHHAFCILNYRQSGYSEEFVENMTAIVENLRADTKIEIVSTSDAVCKACPNRTEPTPGDDVCCRCADKVRRYDAEAMKLLAEMGNIVKKSRGAYDGCSSF